MLAPLRRARIIEFLRRDGAAGLKDMSVALGISMSTLRRDVDYLCEQGHLERTHGGAVLNAGGHAGVELERDIARALESDAKRAIGQRAAALIRPGQTVFIDSGTTTAAAAQAARERGIAFTAITNDLAIAMILSESSFIRVMVAGGTVRSGSSTLLGADTLQAISRLRTNLALIGTHALSEEEMSDSSVELAEVKRVIIAGTSEPVLLADSSKIFSRAFCGFGRLAAMSLLITDTRLSPDKRAILERGGLRIETAPSGHGA
ncbi:MULTISPECIES: DeoR/GlpR family DNA-binding transcription regulator [unclassified Chelatococcus]|uniref:DeoR/GlpR family DNA-binding transcription regulator n=1 Tax=unclassified Chelatococcus TaxID=2638111 RepID=UPI001BD18B72|nr:MULTISPECIES: DeoR/GlpR family DNA-binding transcription regulator [unclassified Chelatococcus]MBS7699900.1 DeoR/GlpR transcriptional regulator [Chelatococcus sp. YT9]MBX3558754.1 DeoR/GlpR transcriptional regulator [Chelatococcus sp.]